MANELSTSVTAGSAPAVSVSIPQYVADGYTGAGVDRTLTFSGSTPPADGSVGLAFIVLDGGTGLSYSNNAYQRLAYWADASPGKAGVTGVDGIHTVSITAWSFVADVS